MPNIDLEIWPGEWGLASIDIECLKVLVSIIGHNLFYYLNLIIPPGLNLYAFDFNSKGFFKICFRNKNVLHDTN